MSLRCTFQACTLYKNYRKGTAMTNLAISNVEFTFTTSDKFQELLKEGYSPKVVGIDMKLNAPHQPLSKAHMVVRFDETGDLIPVELINYAWVAHFALSAYILTPKEAFKEIVYAKEGVAVLNDVKYGIPNPTENK